MWSSFTVAGSGHRRSGVRAGHDRITDGRTPDAGRAGHVADRDRRRAGRRGLAARGAGGGFRAGRSARRPAGHRDTEVRVAFDDDYLYIAALCRDSDPSGIVVNEIRKDFAGREQDTFEVLLDTFADRRNGFVFATNAEGAKADTQIANEGRDVNPNWDAVWWVEARRTADGWTAEFRIPFKTLRFEAGDGKSWGINFARRIRRKNEVSYWSPVSRAYSIFRASSGGDLTGLPALRQGRNLRVKPFLAAARCAASAKRGFDRDRSAGVDVKAGVTPSLTLDATVNPDFAQAEADEQQVNLTQFSLFFPEKREFFLENSGIFYFGDIPRNPRSVGRFRPPEEDLLLFFSRRIGLTDAGEQEPLYGGVRLTGRAGGFRLGVMTMQSKDEDGAAEQELHRRARAARPLRQLRRRRDRPVARAVRRQRRLQPRRRRRRQLPVLQEPQPQRLRRALGHARRDDRPGLGEGVDRLGGQREAPADVDHDHRRGLPRRPGLRAPHRRDAPVLRRRLVAAAGVASQARHPAAPAARAGVDLQRSAGRAGEPHRPRRHSDDVEERLLHRIRVRAARRSDLARRSTSRRASRSRPAATTGSSTCCCSKATTAARCRARSASRSATSGAASQRNVQTSVLYRPNLPAWSSTSACR